MVKIKDFEQLLFSAQMEHPTVEGAFFLCLFFRNGVSITGVNRSFQPEIDSVLRDFRTKTTPWPEYNSDGSLIYTFNQLPYFTISGNDMIEVDVDTVRSDLEAFIYSTKKEFDNLHSRW